MCKNVTQPLTHRGQAAAQNRSRKFKKRFKHVSSLAFFSSHFLHIFVVVVALLNLRPKDTISIWGACESLASAPRLHFISLSALWQGALISAWMQSKRFPFGPRERLPSLLACWLVLTWSWPSEAQDKRHCHTFGWLAPREWPRGNLFNLINFHNLSWWAPKFPANNGKALSTRPTWSCCQSAIHSVWQSDSLPRFDLTFLLHWLSAVGGSSAELELNLNCFVNVLWLDSRPWFDLFMKSWRHLD